MNTSVNGFILAWIVLRTGSLWIVWGFHAAWNISAALIYGLKVSGFIHPGALLSISISCPGWLTGGNYGFEGSLLVGILELTVLLLMLIYSRFLPSIPEALKYFRRGKSN